MKINLHLLILGLSFITASAQFGPQQIISTNADGARNAFPCDLNGDGFIDVLSLSYEDNEIKWYQNLDGNGNFSSERIIFQNLVTNLSFHIVDLDTDNDLDLLLMYNNPRKLVWWENLDGEGNFGIEQILLENQPNYLSAINTADIDNDNDLDIIAINDTSFFDRIVWYENVDGQATLSEEKILIENVVEAYNPLFVDIDNDGNLDILSSHENNGPARLVWYRNLGNGIFGLENEIFQFSYNHSDWTHVTYIQYVDINTDGKKDIIVSTHNDDTGSFIYWIENLDNQGNFASIESIDFPVDRPFYDLDNDGDMDILSTDGSPTRIVWYENEDSLGAYTRKIISTETNSPRDAQAADFNGDGLLDVVSASYNDDKIAWYENGVLGISENLKNSFKLYPNPTYEKVQIQSTTKISIVEIYNSLGKLIKTCFDCQEIDISMLASGNYIFKITDDLNNSENHKVIKE